MTDYMHIWFCCRHCGVQTGGCKPSCPHDHRVEEVDCCALCAKKQENQ